MRYFFVRPLSLAAWLAMVAGSVAAPPEKDAKSEAKPAVVAEKKVAEPKVEAKKVAEKKSAAEAKAAVAVEAKKTDEKKSAESKTAAKPEAKKPEPAKAEVKPAVVKTEAKKVEAKPAAAKPEEKKATAAKPAMRKPTRVDPADNAVQPVYANMAKASTKALTPGGKYPAGDMARPRPAVIMPPTESSQDKPGRVPSDAIVLFDGANVDRWKREGGPKPTDANAKPSDAPLWVVKNGYMECQPKSGGIGTRDVFGDCQLHIEWATPSTVKGSSQGRGNSGVMLHGIGEVQVLDSYENDTYPDGQASAIYGKYPPLVNASRRPGEWQTYDIIVELAKVDPATKQLIRPARLTVLHNGVLTHIAAEIPECRATQFSFGLQDHGNPVRYRNIWLRPLKGYDAAGKSPIAAAKAEVKMEAKVEVKAPAATPAKVEAKPEAKPAAKVEAKPAAKTEAKPAAKTEAKPASQSGAVKQPEAKQPEAKKTEGKQPEAKQPEAKKPEAAATKPAVAVEVKAVAAVKKTESSKK